MIAQLPECKRCQVIRRRVLAEGAGGLAGNWVKGRSTTRTLHLTPDWSSRLWRTYCGMVARSSSWAIQYPEEATAFPPATPGKGMREGGMP